VTDVSENCRRADACDANSSANSASMNSQVEAFETRDPHLFDTNVMRISRSIICLVICFCWQQNRVAHSWTFDVKQPSQVTAGEPNAVSRDRFLQTAFQSSIAAVLGVNLLSQSPANAIMTDPKTGIALPSPGEIETAIPSDWNDIENPFVDGDQVTVCSFGFIIRFTLLRGSSLCRTCGRQCRQENDAIRFERRHYKRQ
jgi:hypothetical protein